MELSEHLSCAHFQIAAGLAPSLSDLDAVIGTCTSDWPSRTAAPAPVAESSGELLQSEQVKATVSRFWDLFVKGEDNAVSQLEYEGFVSRVSRVLIPGLSAEHERALAANTWNEDAGGLDRLFFPTFLAAMVRMASAWADSSAPEDVVSLLEDIFARITRASVLSAETGQAVEKEHFVGVRFSPQDAADNGKVEADCEFGVNLVLNVRGASGNFQVSAVFERQKSAAQIGLHVCCFEEFVCDPLAQAAPTDGVSRVWAPIKDVVPIGAAAVRTLAQTEADATGLAMDFTTSTPGADWLDAAKTKLRGLLSAGSAVAVTDGVGKLCSTGSDRKFSVQHLLAAGIAETSRANIMLVRPKKGSVLYKLENLRRALKLRQPSAAAAALLPYGADGGLETLKLPAFTDLLKRDVAVDAESGLTQPVKGDSLIQSGGLSSLGEALILSPKAEFVSNTALFAPRIDPTEDVPAVSAPKEPQRLPNLPAPFTKGFPARPEGLHNDETDLLYVAATSPVALWVLGQCDDTGEYKTEVCRRLAEKMRLEWLKPAYLLELAVKTPAAHRTRLMERCVQQLQRGLVVSMSDALQLTFEFMASASCKTNGYVLDFPRVMPEDAEAVADFVSKVNSLSGAPQIEWTSFLQDQVSLPDLLAEPEPPKPPPEPQEAEDAPDEGAEGGEAAAEDGDGEAAEGEVPAAEAEAAETEAVEAGDGAAAEPKVAEAALEGEEVPQDGEGAPADAAEEPQEAGEVIEEKAVPVPNPLADVMPRRLVVLSMDTNEVKAWQRTLLLIKHEEKAERQRKREALEEAGDEVPPELEDPEEEEEAPELPALPLEDEEELAALFEEESGEKYIPLPPPEEPPVEEGQEPPPPKPVPPPPPLTPWRMGGLLQTMKQFLPPPPLEVKGLPPLPDVTKEILAEEEDEPVLKSTVADVSASLHATIGVPLLQLHIDGRSPDQAAELLEAVTGRFRGPVRVPMPRRLGGDDEAGEPKDLLRLGLDERAVSRRWSLWKQHCPVSLYDKQLIAGQKEFAVEYAGYVLMFADATKMRRFCTWPKLFLSEAPRINPPGMSLGFAILSFAGHRIPELATRLRERYGFDVVDLQAMKRDALLAPALDAPDTPADVPPTEGDEEGAEEKPPELPPDWDGPRLLAQEKEALASGQPMTVETTIRFVAAALGLEKNLELIRKQKEAIAKAKKELEDAAAAGDEGGVKPDIQVDPESGEPIIELEEPLLVPSRGFVLMGFPETPEQVQALKEQASMNLDGVIILKPSAPEEGEDPPEALDALTACGIDPSTLSAEALEAQKASFEALQGDDTLKVCEVPLQAAEDEQFAQTLKNIDPFYAVVEDPSVAMDIPDPDADVEEAEEGAEPIEKPTIPWGPCGPYCPVTLKEDFWLFPGQKEQQLVFANKVYAFADETLKNKFVAKPLGFVPREREPALPPPRILVTGPTGSAVVRQCELLAGVYRIPVVALETEWRARVDVRRQAKIAAKKRAEQIEKMKEKWAAKKEAEQAAKESGEEAAAEETAPPPEDQPAGEDGEKPKEEVEEEKEPDYDSMTDAEIDALYTESMKVEKPEGEEGEEAPEAEAEAEEQEPEDDGMDDEQRQVLYVEAMRDVLGSHRGACVLDGTFFKDLTDDSIGDEAKEGRKLQSLLVQARRLPDIAIVLKCKNDIAARNVLDLDAIDRDYEERKAAYEKQVALAEEKDEDPPAAPEDLVLDDEDRKESDRAKEKFVENKKAEQESLKEFAQALTEARVPVQKVSADRGDDPTHKGVRWHCRPFMEQRASLLIRSQMVKASPSKAADLESRGLAFPATFERANPMFVDVPSFAGRADAGKYGAEFRNRLYFPASEAEQQQFLERPQDFLHLPKPCRVMVNPAIAICGPPLAGKTALARKLAESTGAVYLSVPEIISQLCDRASLPCVLSKRITQSMRSGSQLSDADVVEALRHRISAPDVLKQGWILDDFPFTVGQAREFTDAGLVPHRVMMLNVPEGLVFARSQQVGMTDKEGSADIVQQEIALQRQRLNAYAETKPALRAFYELTFGNVRDIDGARSPWAVYDQALRETSASVSQRLEYYRRTAQGMAASLYGMSFTEGRLTKAKSDWGQYCPVTLTLGNELLRCQDPRYIVEYQSKVFWLASQENLGLFLNDPEAYLQVPLPEAVPQLLTPTERRNQPTRQLDGYCAVALVDRKELVKASDHHTVYYQQQWWGFENKMACSKFMRRPMRYVQRAKLPSKKPAVQGEGAVTLLNALTKGHDGKLIEPGEMLTFMQSSVAEIICQALVESGERRPLYPGKSAQDSALLFLARFLKAKNSLNTEMFALKVREQFRDYLADCALPEQLDELAKLQGADSWNGSDERRFGELCQRFDELFKLG